MSTTTCIDRFSEFNVLVVGDAILDVYDIGTTERLCREAPAPVVTLQEHVYSCGGAANTAVNTAALGAHVSFLSVVGNDEHGEELADALERGGVDTRNLVRSRSRRTLSKTRVCASSSILVRLDEGDTGPIDDTTRSRVAESFRTQVEGFDIVILSDYGYGFFSRELIDEFRSILVEKQVPVIVDAKDPARFASVSPLAVKPNYEETAALLGLPKLGRGSRIEQVLENADRLLERTGARIVAATLDMEGTLLFEKGAEPYLVSCLPRPDRKTVGAGDSFIGALALGLAAGAPPRLAVRMAAGAAAVAIEKDGTGICSDNDLKAHFSGEQKRIHDVGQLAERIEALQRQNKRVVFTNGCFDLLHRGHVEFLKQARALGDALVVALNSDESIRQLKGEGRPVNSLEDRMEVLAGLQAVDFLVAFDEESPVELLRQLRPDVLAKGGTYSIDSLPEAEQVRQQGGDIEIVPFSNGVSTSHLIHRIQQGAASQGFRRGAV